MPEPEDEYSHKEQLVFLLFNALVKREMLTFDDSTSKKILEISDEVLRFFVEADSFSDDWVPPSQPDEPKQIAGIKAGIASFSYNEIENNAEERAKCGDYEELASLIEKRGYLRNGSSRQLVANRLRGKGNPRSVSLVNVDTWEEVFDLAMKNRLSWSKAQTLWLEINLGVPKETLRSRLRLAEKERVWLKKFKDFIPKAPDSSSG